MARPSPKVVLESFCAVVQEELAEGNDVTLPYLGTLKVEHASSTVQDANASDSPVWSPPQGRITFVPHDDSSFNS
ncbi:MAG: HU family DNA-binding protein [Longimonas sp.]|uniref:HU family DNA-binding protein n=1 Tax=Longimonas sp. TaxID=2039626 RepID=UPI00335C61AE